MSLPPCASFPPRAFVGFLIAILVASSSALRAQAQVQAANDQVTGGSPFAGYCVYGNRPGDPSLRQWVFVTVSSPTAAAASLEIHDGTERVATPVNLAAGVGTYTAHARTQWPAGPINSASVALVIGGNTVHTLNNVTLGSKRPWTCHLVSDICADDIWAFDRKADEVLASARLVQAELNRMDNDDTAGHPLHVRNRFHAIHSRSLEDTLATFPSEQARILRRLGDRRLEVSLMPSTPLGPSLSTAEIVQWFLPSRRFELQAPGAAITGINYQETPALPFGLATVLAECGILGTSVSPLGHPFHSGEAGPVEYWEGPDGSRVFWHGTDGYWEAQNKTWQELLGRSRTIYEPFGRAVYPWSQYLVFGTYLDLHSASYTAAGVSGQRAQEAWAALQAAHPGALFPRIESSTQSLFYEALDRERRTHPGLDAGIPVRRGDLGADWESWPLALAPYCASWREAMALLPAADALTAINERLLPGSSSAVAASLALAHRETSRLSDHAWNGNSNNNRVESANLRRGWGTTALTEGRRVIDQGLASLGAQILTGPGRAVLVFNKETFATTGPINLDLTGTGLQAGPLAVFDRLTVTECPSQLTTSGGVTFLTFEPGLVPPLGLRVFDLVATSPSARGDAVWISQDSATVVVMDNRHYRVTLDAARHQVTSLLDKGNHDLELLPPGRPLGLATNAGVAFTPAITNGVVASLRRGAAFGEVELSGSANGANYTTRIRLHTLHRGIDLEIAVSGNLSVERGPLFHAGIAALAPETWVQGPAAVYRAGPVSSGGEQLPDANFTCHAFDRFLDVTSTTAGLTIAPSDHMVAFLDSWSSFQRMPAGSVAVPLWGRGWTNYPTEKLLNQNGETRLRARFALLPHGPGHDRVGAYQFASARGRHEPLAVLLPASRPGVSLPVWSAGSVEPPTVVGTTLALALQGAGSGHVLRLWDLGAARASVPTTVEFPGLGGIAAGNRTDLLERDLQGAQNDFTVSAGQGHLTLKARGLAAVRFTPGAQPGGPAPVIQSVTPATFTTLLPGQVLTVTGPGVGRSVTARLGAAQIEQLTPLNANTLRLSVDRADRIGPIQLTVTSPLGNSAPFPLTAAAPASPTLVVTPPLVDPQRLVAMEVGSQANSAATFLLSRVNAPFVLPGIISLGIGGPGADLFLLGGDFADAAGICRQTAVNPGLGMLATVYLQAIVFSAGGVVTSNVSTLRLR